jgi:hypothetical protein
MLARERHCSVQGVTISAAQAAYCRTIGLDVWQTNVEEQPFPATGQVTGQAPYEIVFMLEALSHIRDKRKLLQQLRKLAPRLVLSTDCMIDGYRGPRRTFGDSMIFCTQSELLDDLKQAGWRVRSMRNRRFQSIPTLFHWKKNLTQIYGTDTPPGHIGILKNLTDTALRDLGSWCQSFPLLDIVAD